MTPSRRIVLVLVALASLLGARLAPAAQDPVQGSGVAATQHRDVGAFSAVSLGASFAVILRSAGREGIAVVADDNLMPLIETSLRSRGDERTLRIEVARGARIDPKTPIVITIDVVKLDAIALGGSGSITGSGLKPARLAAAIGGSGEIRLPALDVAELDVSIGGSGRFVADGRAGKLSVSVAGSGRCDADRLVARDVAVSVVGSGTAAVHADASLSASIAGSGDVLYSGDAQPRASIAGRGRLRRL
jgi:Putative auto-transporter adhesin, head GIN domain